MIVLCEPPRPAGFVSGGFRYQDEVMAPRLAAYDGERRVVAPEQLAATVAELRRRPEAVVVVDGLYAQHAPLPAGAIALLHMVPHHDAWSAVPCPVLATAAGTVEAPRVRALASATEIVEPGLDPCFQPSSPPPGTADGRVRIVCVGTFGLEKGQAALWEAMARARVPCELVLLGAGTERFAPATHRQGLATRRARGVVAPAEVAAELQAADLCVSWSRSESFGMAVAEAVACGTPVLAFSTGRSRRWCTMARTAGCCPPTRTTQR
jgi:glycosyltransferase involved in cell wall biosynthesis